MLTEFDNLERLLDLKNFVIDVAILPSGEPIVIELNPYNDHAGNGTFAFCFNWETERDILEDTNGLYEIDVYIEIN